MKSFLARIIAIFFSPFISRRNTRNMIKEKGIISTVKFIFHYRMPVFKKYKDYLSIVATVKNEADYIAEWIEYHILMGVSHFYIYDNESNDNLCAVLKPYIDKKIVTYIKYDGINKQIEIYNDAIKKFALKTKWLAIIDIDEFIKPIKEESLISYLKHHEDYGQLLFSWFIFGSSNHEKKPSGLVIENYLYRDTKPWIMNNILHTKAIVNPRYVDFANIHWCECSKKSKNVDFNDFRINHYFSKSKNEYINKKMARGKASGAEVPYLIEQFDIHNKNDVFDDSMLEYVPLVYEKLKKD